MIEKLKMYLDGAVSYHEGCSIFLLASKNKKLATTLLRKEESDYTREKLRYEIKKILNSFPASPEPVDQKNDHTVLINFPAEPHTIAPATEKVIFINTSEETPKNPLLEEITAKWKELYRQRGHLHGRLHQEEDQSKSFEIAKQIINIQPKIDKLKLDIELLESGQVPSGYLKAHVSGEQLVELRNTKQYISRYEKLLKTQTDPKARVHTQKLIDKYKTKLKAL